VTVNVPSRARALLDRSRDALLDGLAAETAHARFMHGHQAALFAAKVIVDLRGFDGSDSIWESLRAVAHEYADTAEFFEKSLSSTLTRTITAQEANTLLRDAEAFHHAVEASLALPYRNVLPGTLPDVTEESAR
jgi:hypothetical protein